MEDVRGHRPRRGDHGGPDVDCPGRPASVPSTICGKTLLVPVDTGTSGTAPLVTTHAPPSYRALKRSPASSTTANSTSAVSLNEASSNRAARTALGNDTSVPTPENSEAGDLRSQLNEPTSEVRSR